MSTTTVSRVAALVIVVGFAAAAFEPPAGGFRSSTARSSARRLPSFREAVTGQGEQGAGKMAEEEESIPSLDEAVFLEKAARDLRDVQDLSDKYNALDEPAASPQTVFAKLDEAVARMPHSSGDFYESAARRCHELSRKSVEETALAAEREAAAEKKLVESRHFGGTALNGFAFLSLAASAAAMVVSNTALDVSQISPPVLDFSIMPAVDLSSADFALPSFGLPSVDVGALLGINELAEGTKQALAAVVSTVGTAADAVQTEAVKMQSHATDFFATTSDYAADIKSAVPSQLVAAQDTATRAATDLTVNLQREASSFQSKTFAGITDLKAEAVAFQSRTIDAAAGFRSAVEGTKDLLLAEIDAAGAGAQELQDSIARQIGNFPPSSSSSLTLRVETPDWRSILASANEAEDAMIASFNRQLETVKSSVTEASQIVAWAEDEGRGALLARASAVREAAIVELTKPRVQPLGPITPPLTVELPEWIDESTIGLASRVIAQYY